MALREEVRVDLNNISKRGKNGVVFMTEAKEFLSLLAERDAQYADFRFTDLSGAWHHMSMPTSAITKTILEAC